MNRMFMVALVVLSAGCFKKNTTSGGSVAPYEPPTPVDKNWQFEATPMWADEFNTPGAPDASKWDYDLGGSGWGNNELQNYTNSTNNAVIQDGKLVITARKETSGGRNYSSTRLVTRGKGDFLYGRVEVRAKLPSGRGTWPAIWMLPTDRTYGDWPKSGEIDIMEHVGYDPNRVHFSVHTQSYNHGMNTQRSTNRMVPTAFSEYHVYRTDWTPYAVRGYIDGELMFTFVNEGRGSAVWPFDQRFHLLLNVAVGGNWGGVQGVDDAVFPAAMEVDYVRVYKMIP